MGCGSSANKVHVTAVDVKPQPPGSHPASPLRPPTSKTVRGKQGSENNNNASPKSRKSSGKRLKNGALGSQGSLQSHGSGSDSRDGSDRGRSASSKGSQHSGDSGFDDHNYAKFVTEESDPDRVKEIEDQFESPGDLDLGLTGTACPQRYSAKDKERMQEKLVMDNLRDEGLIQRPVSRAANGLAFEIVSNTMDMFAADSKRRPPARLAKLEKRRRKKEKPTESELAAKIEQADERRKELEQVRIERIQKVAYKSDVQCALDSFESQQKQMETTQQAKDQAAIENREKKLREMRDKLRAKQEHAERVRRRKLAALPEAGDAMQAEVETPVGGGV